MDQQLKPVEQKMDDAFKNAPKMSENAKKSMADWWPWIALVFGLLQVWAAWGLYDWGNKINRAADSLNRFSSAFGVNQPVEKLGVMYWLSLIALAVDGVVLLLAYPGLKARKKSGWNMLLLGALVNAVYGVFSAFTDRGGAGSLIWSLISSAVALYLLNQIKDQYKS